MKTAVICALNFDKNPGMVTVDRAAVNFLSDRGLEIDWLVAGDHNSHNPGAEDLPRYGSVFNAPGFPESYELIVFWGDFLQSHAHHASLVTMVLEGGYANDIEQAQALLRKTMLLEGASSETLQKVGIFGSTIHADGVAMLVDQNFRKALSRLFIEARSVRMRDPVSSYRAAMLSGRDGTVGLDAAFLKIKGQSWNTLAEKNRCTGPVRIAVIGGRSDRYTGRKLKFSALAAMRSFERQGLETTLEVLPWLSSGLGKWAWFSVETPSQVRSPDYCLQRLGECDALITDVYHAAVNAWVLGIPVILLGTGAELDRTAIKSKKKELLSLSLFAGENYLFLEKISYFGFKALGDHMRKVLTNEQENRTIFAQRARDVDLLVTKLESEMGLPAKAIALANEKSARVTN